MTQFQFKLEGADKLKKRLDLEGLAYKPLRRFFNATGKEIKKKAKENTPSDTGKLKSQIKYKKVRDKGRLPGGVKVFVTTPYAKYVHGAMDGDFEYKGLKFPEDKGSFDRTTPHWPPFSALTGWADRHGIPVFLVARSIAEKGTAIVPFIKMGYEQSEEEIGILLFKEMNKIEKNWKKSR
jgi:hypothetical protein